MREWNASSCSVASLFFGFANLLSLRFHIAFFKIFYQRASCGVPRTCLAQCEVNDPSPRTTTARIAHFSAKAAIGPLHFRIHQTQHVSRWNVVFFRLLCRSFSLCCRLKRSERILIWIETAKKCSKTYLHHKNEWNGAGEMILRFLLVSTASILEYLSGKLWSFKFIGRLTVSLFFSTECLCPLYIRMTIRSSLWMACTWKKSLTGFTRISIEPTDRLLLCVVSNWAVKLKCLSNAFTHLRKHTRATRTRRFHQT